MSIPRDPPSWPTEALAGLVVAIMLVPQGMAYAMLAGLPPQAGLYASIVPAALYALLGSSPALSVGPAAIDSLLVASALAPLAVAGGPEYVALALLLALLVGLIQLALGALRMGTLVNFLSVPVLAGFTNAAALIIALSQLRPLLGLPIPSGEGFVTPLRLTLAHLGELNPATALLGVGSLALLLLLRARAPRAIARAGPLLVVLLGTVPTALLHLDVRAGVKIVGTVPSGLMPLTIPPLDAGMVRALLPSALALALIGTMESISVGKVLASRCRRKLEPSRELIALGAGNVSAAFTGAFPVTGGLSRSMVNYAAGSRSGRAALITSLLVALSLLLFTPAFYYLPNAVLAAIIIVAVSSLFDLGTLRRAWRYRRSDAVAWLVTAAAVLATSVQMGIVIGVATTLLLYLWRSSRPHIAVLGRIAGSESYRNVKRHRVQTWEDLLILRVDENLYFANSRFLEEYLLAAVADHPRIQHLVLSGIAINSIDTSALETLEELHRMLAESGISLHFAALKGPVMDRLYQVGFVEAIGTDAFHLSIHDALLALGKVETTDEARHPAPAYAPEGRR